jgi:hypothetical protein
MTAMRLNEAPAWLERLNADPLPWLLDRDNPAVRHLTLRDVYRLPASDRKVREAQRAAMRADPIRTILAAQHPEGWWVKPGPGYSPKYTGTVWQVIFLDQLGADPDDRRIRTACEYLLAHTATSSGGLGLSGANVNRPPAPSTVVHCLNGNLLRAFIGFGLIDDPRVRAAIDWQAKAITGGVRYYHTSASGPGFLCAANENQPCAWGAIKALSALARVPADQRDSAVRAAIQAGAEFLLSRDPAVADYPMGWGNTKPNGSWFKLGFPSGYVADVLQNLEVLAELGYGADPRLDHGMRWLLAGQDAAGRWPNRYTYAGKMWIDIDRPGAPSKWVTLRACRLLARIAGG